MLYIDSRASRALRMVDSQPAHSRPDQTSVQTVNPTTKRGSSAATSSDPSAKGCKSESRAPLQSASGGGGGAASVGPSKRAAQELLSADDAVEHGHTTQMWAGGGALKSLLAALERRWDGRKSGCAYEGEELPPGSKLVDLDGARFVFLQPAHRGSFFGWGCLNSV